MSKTGESKSGVGNCASLAKIWSACQGLNQTEIPMSNHENNYSLSEIRFNILSTGKHQLNALTCSTIPLNLKTNLATCILKTFSWRPLWFAKIQLSQVQCNMAELGSCNQIVIRTYRLVYHRILTNILSRQKCFIQRYFTVISPPPPNYVEDL